LPGGQILTPRFPVLVKLGRFLPQKIKFLKNYADVNYQNRPILPFPRCNIGGKLTGPNLVPPSPESKGLSPRKGQPDPGRTKKASRPFPGGPDLGSEALECCLRELVRYYRHSSVGRRTSGIVHQINGPLQVLSFHLELLEQKSQEELNHLSECPLGVAERLGALRDYRLEKIRQFRQELENLQTLVRRLSLQGVHEESQEQVYLDLNQIFLLELELYLAQPFFKHQVRKKFCFQESLPPLYGYYIDFSQSFRNLLDNALEAMEGAETRELTVKTSLQDGCRLLSIRDTGVGIPPAILPRIFEPFFTTKGSPDSPRAGLGLFMAQRLLSPYGGQIQVQSRFGETWLTVLLPVKPGGSEP
jgi:signal transduction histidine kinase